MKVKRKARRMTRRRMVGQKLKFLYYVFLTLLYYLSNVLAVFEQAISSLKNVNPSLSPSAKTLITSRYFYVFVKKLNF